MSCDQQGKETAQLDVSDIDMLAAGHQHGGYILCTSSGRHIINKPLLYVSQRKYPPSQRELISCFKKPECHVHVTRYSVNWQISLTQLFLYYADKLDRLKHSRLAHK